MTQPQQAALLDVDPHQRRDHDFYATPAWMTRALIGRVAIAGSVLEPCAGTDAITSLFRSHADVTRVVTNDIDQARRADYHLDATTDDAWQRLPVCHWTVTNPPFDAANAIVPRAVARTVGQRASHGVAMLLRLSWLEPTEDCVRKGVLRVGRADFLRRCPPDRLIVMPRYDFRGNGQTDSVTAAWFVWHERRTPFVPAIEIVTQGERDALMALDRLGHSA